MARLTPDPDNRRAALRAQAKERDWNHPRRGDDENVLQACADPYCRYCKDQDGEVREGFWL